jgi:hypothetical protein
MNADDILERASRALRQQSSSPSADARRTRSRVLARASRRARWDKLAITLAPLAAVLAMSTAWASTRGGIPLSWSRVAGFFAWQPGEPKAGATRGRAGAIVSPAVAAAPASAAHDPMAPSVPEIGVDMLPPATEARRTAPAAREEPVEQAAASQARSSDDASRLYAEAHRAHFVDRDPSAALRAWNAYLLAAPEGALVPEARYNRALALVRLGRRAEARQALEPFAKGMYGGYRGREAKELVAALGEE